MFRFTDLIIFQLTRDCNLRCEYCVMLEKDKYKGEIIDFDTYKKIIHTIAKQRIINSHDYQNRALKINFHGGEPLLVGPKYFYKLLEYADRVFRDNNIKVNFGIQTNGVLLNEEFLFIMNKFDMSIGLSIDDLGKGNDKRMKNSEKFYREKLELAKKYNATIGLLPTVHKYNVNRFQNFEKETSKIFNRNKAMSSNLLLDPVYNGKDSDIEISGKELYRKVYKHNIDREINSKDWSIHKGIGLKVNNIIYDLLTIHKNNWKSGCWGKYCGAGISMIAVHPKGEMGYCDRYTRMFDESYIQNALDYDFLGIFQLKKTIDFNYKRSFVWNEAGCDQCRAEFSCSYECLSFYYSKYGKYGIDKSKVCAAELRVFDYVEKNLLRIAKNYKEIGKPITYSNLHYPIDFRKDTIKKLRDNNIDVEIDTKNYCIYFV